MEAMVTVSPARVPAIIIAGKSGKESAFMMRASTLLFGATSIVGFNLARSFPETILPFVTPGSRAQALREWPVLNLIEIISNYYWPKLKKCLL